MKVKEGDVLVCPCENCEMELTVTKACCGDSCDHEATCEVEVVCCGQQMTVKDRGE